MRNTLLAVIFLAIPGVAMAQGIVVPANLQIYDGVSGNLQKERGRLIVDDFYAVNSRFQLQTSGGKALCSGTRTAGQGGGTFRGKCFGYDARGSYTQSASGVVRMKWNYSNSWISLLANVN